MPSGSRMAGPSRKRSLDKCGDEAPLSVIEAQRSDGLWTLSGGPEPEIVPIRERLDWSHHEGLRPLQVAVLGGQILLTRSLVVDTQGVL
jgi:hypothetical protein